MDCTICTINFLNKKENFKEDAKVFFGDDKYNKAAAWGKKNLENFSLDMIVCGDVPSVSELAKIVSNNVAAMNTALRDTCTIAEAQAIGRRYKVKSAEILKHLRPCGRLNCRVWDENGKTVPYNKRFY
jgi:hypothetical protein